MKTPEKIYISPSIRTEIAYYSRILIGNPTFNICPRYGNEIEYVRADIHEAEIDVTQTALRLMNKTAEVMHKEIDALKDENTKMKGLLEDMEFVDDSLAFYVDSPERLAELLADDQLGDDKELTTGVAINHPSKLMLIWLTGGEERELNWE